jgi:hypothetical protein
MTTVQLRMVCRGLVVVLATGASACRNEVQPPTLPLLPMSSEVTRKAPKPQPIDLKRDAKRKPAGPRVGDAANPAK